jgi:hypothetical protein
VVKVDGVLLISVASASDILNVAAGERLEIVEKEAIEEK